MPNDALMELVSRLNGKVIISSEITKIDLENIDLNSLIAGITKRFEESGASILGKKELSEILAGFGEKKEPIQIVEVLSSAGFKPTAKDVSSKFRIRETKAERVSSGVSDFVDHFQDRFRKLRDIIRSHGNGFSGMIGSIEGIKQYMDGREIVLVGMIYDRIVTKKGHLLVTIEDESGTAKVLFIKPARKLKDSANELFDSATKLARDDVIAVKGKLSNPFIIANKMLWPDIPIHPMHTTEEDIAIAFVSDLHIGHRLFMEKQFGKFLEWLNGGVDNRKDLAAKVKYIVIAGDLVDGIGIYPEQEKELNITDIYRQYSVFFDFLKSIPDYIEIFAMPGNHDAVQRAEPQPRIGNCFLKDFAQENVHLVSSPCYLNLHGVRVLAYHGTSLDSIIHNVSGCSYGLPAEAAKEALRRRHLSPIYGNNVIVPSKTDAMVIDEVPDILHMGHIHKNGIDEYHGTTVLNSGTWQDRTSYQIKQGHIPSPALLPVFETKILRTSLIDFNIA